MRSLRRRRLAASGGPCRHLAVALARRRHLLLQVAGRPEGEPAVRRDEDLLAAHRAHSGAPRSPGDLEGAEVLDLHGAPADQRRFHGLEDRLDDRGRFALGQPAMALVDRRDEIGLGHPLAGTASNAALRSRHGQETLPETSWAAAATLPPLNRLL